MKVLRLFTSLALLFTIYSCSTSQEVSSHENYSPNVTPKVVQLTQIPGEFTNGNIKLKPGAYRFEVKNDHAGKDVGLVLALKKDEISEADHIQNAYVSELVKEGETVQTKGDVMLKKGEYVYFCPLNPTPQYTITVE